MYMPENKRGDFTPAPVGTHIAICYRIIDLGTQTEEYEGKKRVGRRVLIGWELPNERMEANGKPFIVARRYSFSSNEKASLRKDLESWRGKGFSDDEITKFDLQSVLTKTCMLSIMQEQKKTGGVRSKITAVSPIIKGMPIPPMTNIPCYICLDPDEFDIAEFNLLSQGLKATIQASPEWAQLQKLGLTPLDGEGGPAPASSAVGASENAPRQPPDLDDDIPF